MQQSGTATMLARAVYIFLLTGEKFEVLGLEGQGAGICVLERETVEGALA